MRSEQREEEALANPPQENKGRVGVKNSGFPCFLGSLWPQGTSGPSHSQQRLLPLLHGDGAARLGRTRGQAETPDFGVGRRKHLTASCWQQGCESPTVLPETPERT